MRISDWSSDVCSSDLGAIRVRNFARAYRKALSHGRFHYADGASPGVDLRTNAHRNAELIRNMPDKRALECGYAERLQMLLEHLGKRSEEHTSELQSLMRISYAVFCLKKKTAKQSIQQ